MMSKFTALLNCNRRKRANVVELTSIRQDGADFGRDHCWVDFDLFEHLVPKNNTYKTLIRFEADINMYLAIDSKENSYRQIYKKGLKNIEDITKIRTIKNKKKLKD
jgi:hypothetical protein